LTMKSKLNRCTKPSRWVSPTAGSVAASAPQPVLPPLEQRRRERPKPDVPEADCPGAEHRLHGVDHEPVGGEELVPLVDRELSLAEHAPAAIEPVEFTRPTGVPSLGGGARRGRSRGSGYRRGSSR
jgi:hypothetical protein